MAGKQDKDYQQVVNIPCEYDFLYENLQKRIKPPIKYGSDFEKENITTCCLLCGAYLLPCNCLNQPSLF